jgi:hypothetical protein
VLVVGIFAVSMVAAQTCQKRQIRVTKEAAVARATRAVDFRPTRTQVRLVRQGLNGHAFWAVSLSIPAKDGGFTRLTTARVDANSGKLVALTGNTTTTKEPTP